MTPLESPASLAIRERLAAVPLKLRNLYASAVVLEGALQSLVSRAESAIETMKPGGNMATYGALLKIGRKCDRIPQIAMLLSIVRTHPDYVEDIDVVGNLKAELEASR